MENYELQTIEEPDEGVPFDILLNKIDNSILEIVTCPICKNIGWNIRGRGYPVRSRGTAKTGQPKRYIIRFDTDGSRGESRRR